ncbi:hypothetical protein F4821DRAFT_198822 [Hypoxylon rubiginosum]|uniref:Uncharacterized protein n=1 Tax=Hypoxylon rubiginosum TaxID=110542 RepID=A0ACC0DET9_9PEZI|nr:hypothetical protein F4821DRAFT_198822 [Hypoxylon rubiginosum]
MSWTETSPGVYSTELGGVEKVYRFISHMFKPTGREHYGIYCACTLDFGSSFARRDKATAVRDAWKVLRQEFPALAIVPDGLTKKTYVLPDASKVEKWADETFIVDFTDPDAVLASYPARDHPSMHFFPESNQVLFLASHWRIDGIGVCIIMERLFSILAASTPPPAADSWKNDLHRVSPRLEDALDAPTEETPEIHALAQKQIAEHHKNAIHAGGIPYLGDATTPPGSPVRTHIKFNRATSGALIAACKARGITVTSAFYAALASAVLAMSIDEAPEKYTAVMAANMRDYVQPPYNSKDHAVQAYVIGRAPTVNHSCTFAEKTAQFAAYVRDWCDDEFLRAYRVTTRTHYDAMTKRPAPPAGAPPPKPPSGVTLSSLGVIEKLLPKEYEGGEVTMTDFHFGVSMLTRQMLLYVWTFDGKMSFSINYNEAYHDAPSAEALLEYIRQVLAKELGVTLEPEEKI